MTLAQQLGTRYVYLVGVLPGRVLRARAVATADLIRAHLYAQVVMAAPVAPTGSGPNLAPPPASRLAAQEELAGYERIRWAALQVDAVTDAPQGEVGPSWPGPEVAWEVFCLVELEVDEDQAAGALWVDRLGAALVSIGQAVLRESAGAQGVARALTTFRGG